MTIKTMTITALNLDPYQLRSMIVLFPTSLMSLPVVILFPQCLVTKCSVDELTTWDM